MLYEKSLSEALEGGGSVDSIYADLSKAFNRANHTLLIDKLSAYGVGGSLLCWLSSYLTERQQIVKVKSYYSRVFTASSTVPQGGHLAPLLFNLFINDVVTCFHHSKVLLYADDIKIFRIVDSPNASEEVQDDILRFEEWCHRNMLNINYNKCFYIQFSRKQKPKVNKYHFNDTQNEVMNVETIRDLGVIFDVKLTFKNHVEQCCNKALKLLGFIKRHTKGLF